MQNVRVSQEGEDGLGRGSGGEERGMRNERKQEERRSNPDSKPPTPCLLTKEHTQDPPALPLTQTTMSSELTR
jgi:hypothetical protein